MKHQNCFDCDAEIDSTVVSPSCPICKYGPMCQECTPIHLDEIHPGEEIPEAPPPQEYIPTPEHRQSVRVMSACSITEENMAQIIGCNRRELRRYYKFEIENGSQEVVFKVADRLYQEAMKGNVSALIFIMKTKGNWREREDGAPLDDEAQKLVKGLNEVERGQRLMRIMRKRHSEKAQQDRGSVPESAS